MITSYSRINFLTINDAHSFTDVLIKNNVMDFKCLVMPSSAFGK